MLRFKLLIAALFLMATGNAMAITYKFDKDPFAGTPVLRIPGRQIVGGELFLPDFVTLNPFGQNAINTLPTFSAANFEITGANSVPEPSDCAVLGIGLMVGAMLLGRRTNRR